MQLNQSQNTTTSYGEEEAQRTALEPVEPLIRELRGERVMLDSDLARLYGVETRTLNQAVRRNGEVSAGFLFPPQAR